MTESRFPTRSRRPQLRAILLAGGAGRRLGGVDKARLLQGGATLLEHWCAALQDRGISGVVVGPAVLRPLIREPLQLTREDPPLAGPAAAVCAGARMLPETDDDEAVLLLAVDTLQPAPLLDWLREQWAASPEGTEAVIPVDDSGRQQRLSAVLDRRWLDQRVQESDPADVMGASLRWLLRDVRAAAPLLPTGLGRDVDSPQDARELGVDL